MMWLMIQTWNKIDSQGREEEPEMVRSATATYRQNNDVFLQFIMEMIKYDPHNAKSQISLVEIYSAFKSWFSESYPGIQAPTREEMKDDICNKWGELNASHRWKGYRLKTLDDLENEGQVLVFREEDLNVSDISECEGDDEVVVN